MTERSAIDAASRRLALALDALAAAVERRHEADGGARARRRTLGSEGEVAAARARARQAAGGERSLRRPGAGDAGGGGCRAQCGRRAHREPHQAAQSDACRCKRPNGLAHTLISRLASQSHTHYIARAGLRGSSGAISPGPYRSSRELSLTGLVGSDIWRPPTFVGNPGSMLQRPLRLRTDASP